MKNRPLSGGRRSARTARRAPDHGPRRPEPPPAAAATADEAPSDSLDIDHFAGPAPGPTRSAPDAVGDGYADVPLEETQEGCFKFNGIPQEGDTYTFTHENVTWSITDEITDPNGSEVVGFNYTSNQSIASVEVKGGENSTIYTPAGDELNADETEGTSLFAPENDASKKEGDHHQISQVVFCPGALTDGGNGGNGDREPETAFYQVDFVVGEPLEQVGPEDGEFYNDEQRLIRFLHGSSETPVTRTGSAEWNLPEATADCIETEDIRVHDNGTASVRFTVADGCELTFSLASYEKPGPGFDRSMTQDLFDSETETLGPGTHTLVVELPP